MWTVKGRRIIIHSNRYIIKEKIQPRFMTSVNNIIIFKLTHFIEIWFQPLCIIIIVLNDKCCMLCQTWLVNIRFTLIRKVLQRKSRSDINRHPALFIHRFQIIQNTPLLIFADIFVNKLPQRNICKPTVPIPEYIIIYTSRNNELVR